MIEHKLELFNIGKTDPKPLQEAADALTRIYGMFNGSDYKPLFDEVRLTGQAKRVFEAMKDGAFRTLAEIEGITGDPQASVSAQLRHLRKRRFGSHTINKRPRGDRENGLFEYQLLVNKGKTL